MTNDEKLDKKLDEMLAGQVRTEQWMAKHDARHEFIEQKVTEHRTALFGNGVDGMKTQLQSQIDRCTAVQAAKPKSGPFATVMLAVLTNVLSGSILMMIAWAMFLHGKTDAILKAANVIEEIAR